MQTERMERVHKNGMCRQVKWFEQNKCGASTCDYEYYGRYSSQFVIIHFRNIFSNESKQPSKNRRIVNLIIHYLVHNINPFFPKICQCLPFFLFNARTIVNHLKSNGEKTNLSLAKLYYGKSSQTTDDNNRKKH